MYEVDKLDAFAWKGIMPEGMLKEEQFYFFRMYYIYSSYKQQLITKAEAEKMKAESIADKKEMDFYDGLYRCRVENSQRADNAKCQLLLGVKNGKSDRELLNIAIECIYGLTGDKAMYESYMKMISGRNDKQ